MSLASPHLLQALGWALAHFLWQGTLVAVVAAIAMGWCEKPAARYVIGVAGLAIMLAAPIATFLFADGMSGPLGLTVIFPQGASPVASVAAAGPLAPRLHLLPWLVQAWFCGVLFFSLRFAGGFVLLERWRQSRSAGPGAEVLALCHRLQHQLGLSRTIGYLECDWLQAPAVLGWLRPVVLLPVTVLTGFSPEQLGAVIAHELAHIRRHDAFVNLFQIFAETLLFYHPAVWWLSRRIRAEREICCDEIAISLCGNRIAYARALTLMEEWKRAPALVLAANHGFLSERIFCVLGRKAAGHTSRALNLACGLFLLGTALAVGNALAVSDPVPPARTRVTEPVVRLAAPPIEARVMPQAPVLPAKPDIARTAHTHHRLAMREPAPVESLAPPAAAIGQPSPAPDSMPSDAPVFKLHAPTPPVIVISPVSQTNVEDADPVTCRAPQPLPASRFSGPRVCMARSQWALLHAKSEDISPDGKQLVAADGYTAQQLQRTCLATPITGSSNSVQSLPACF